MPAQELKTHVLSYAQEFPLLGGASLPQLRLAYETWGEASPDGDNVVVVLHALSGSSHVCSSEGHPAPGWWESMFVPGSPLGRDRHFVICANILGGCYGTTGPSSIDPTTGAKYGCRFPQITIGDMVVAQRLLLQQLGIRGPVTVIGGSMGGMLALDWALRFPDDVKEAIVLAAPAKSYPQAIALRAAQREAILVDPDWNGGDYDDERFPARGLALARKIGMITYRSESEFCSRFGRQMRDPRPHFQQGLFEIQSYLDHQGRKFVSRFDANTYLYFSRAMDLYDLADGYPSLEDSVGRLRGRALFVAIDSDFLCPPWQVRETHDAMKNAGGNVRMGVVRSIHGHDAFLIEAEQIHALVGEFLAG